MKKNIMRAIIFSIVLMLGVSLLSACGESPQNTTDVDPNTEVGNKTNDETTNEAGNETGNNPIVTIEMENGKKILVELYPDKAPNTVNSFIYVIEQGHLDGTIFHRVSPTFMVQGGEMKDGTLGYSIRGEFTSNGFEGNDISHERGVISMARTGVKDSATTQFFIMTADSTFLDNEYAAFGKVIEGMDAVDEIASADWSLGYGDGTGQPAEDQIMVKVTVDTQGETYPEPEKIPE